MKRQPRKKNRRNEPCQHLGFGLQASTAGGMGSIPGPGPGTKIPHDVGHSQNKKQKKITNTGKLFGLDSSLDGKIKGSVTIIFALCLGCFVIML